MGYINNYFTNMSKNITCFPGLDRHFLQHCILIHIPLPGKDMLNSLEKSSKKWEIEKCWLHQLLEPVRFPLLPGCQNLLSIKDTQTYIYSVHLHRSIYYEVLDSRVSLTQSAAEMALTSWQTIHVLKASIVLGKHCWIYCLLKERALSLK